MTDIFKFKDYRTIIKHVIKSKPNNGYGELGRLAKKIGVQSSYLSQVLSGTKDLTVDQAIGTVAFLELSPLETKFFVGLVQFSRTGTKQARDFFKTSLDAIRSERRQIQSRVTGGVVLSDEQKAIFYSQWLYMAVWLASTLDGAPQTSQSIRDLLGLSPSQVEHSITVLRDAGLIRESNGTIIPIENKTHLPSDDPLVSRHHINWRLKAIERALNLNPSELMFTAPISISKADFDELREEILELIERCSKRVMHSKAEQVAFLNIDLLNINLQPRMA